LDSSSEHLSLRNSRIPVNLRIRAAAVSGVPRESWMVRVLVAVRNSGSALADSFNGLIIQPVWGAQKNPGGSNEITPGMPDSGVGGNFKI
jgi:hypothetical protein